MCVSKSSIILSPPSPHHHVCTGPSGNTCGPVTKISWLNTDANPLTLFSGGLPLDDNEDHNTVTVIQGTDHIALDFTSSVIDYVTVLGKTVCVYLYHVVLCCIMSCYVVS